MDPALIIPPILVAAAIYAIVQVFLARIRVARSMEWPSTRGRILDTSIELEHTHHHDDNHGSVYAFKLQYEYFVAGQRFVGDQLSVNPQLSTSFRSRAEDRSVEYYPRAEVTVYYNPAKPQQACLERTSEGEWLHWLIAVGFLVVAALVAGQALGGGGG
jgi:hypothetical protein